MLLATMSVFLGPSLVLMSKQEGPTCRMSGIPIVNIYRSDQFSMFPLPVAHEVQLLPCNGENLIKIAISCQKLVTVLGVPTQPEQDYCQSQWLWLFQLRGFIDQSFSYM